jgi:predicted LPLAT superfamily acyltransferase
MGGTVRFPEGPWSLAKALGVPVILGFGLYRGGRRYDVSFELFAECITAERTNRAAELRAHAQRYAQRLEFHAQRAPYNWFNFYDYWADEPAGSAK